MFSISRTLAFCPWDGAVMNISAKAPPMIRKIRSLFLLSVHGGIFIAAVVVGRHSLLRVVQHGVRHTKSLIQAVNAIKYFRQLSFDL